MRHLPAGLELVRDSETTDFNDSETLNGNKCNAEKEREREREREREGGIERDGEREGGERDREREFFIKTNRNNNSDMLQ